MSRTTWQPLNSANIGKVELNSFVVVARPDGKSWSGILIAKGSDSFALANANMRTVLHYMLNPTASFTVMSTPKWELGFGQPRLNL